MAEELVTQVQQKKKSEVHGKLEQFVQTRRLSQAKKPTNYPTTQDQSTRPRGNSKATTDQPNSLSVVTSPRPRASSRSIHEKRPTAPYKDDQLLPPFSSLKSDKKNKSGMKCLVLDLDETLIHSSFKPVEIYDYIVPIEIEEVLYQVYVAKRPGVDEFLMRLSKIYEIVVFTASLPKYANPVLDKLDVNGVVDWRLFRASCTCVQGTYVKDMLRMGRDISKVIIIDNSPHSFAFQPENAIPCDSWFDDLEDRELFDLVPILEGLADDSVEDVIEELERLQINGIAAVEQGMMNEEEDEDEYNYISDDEDDS